MHKSDICETARAYSLMVSVPVYVWENDWGEWKWGVEFPMQYAEIIATYTSGEEVK